MRPLNRPECAAVARAAGGSRGAMLVVLACAWLCAGPGCGHAPQAARGIDPATRAQQLIDSGNAAYRHGDYRLAVRRYAAAAVERKDDPAAYYGMGMALAKLGRDEEA